MPRTSNKFYFNQMSFWIQFLGITNFNLYLLFIDLIKKVLPANYASNSRGRKKFTAQIQRDPAICNPAY